MEKNKIVIVMGGPSSEATISRMSAQAIFKALTAKGYQAETLEFVPETFVEDIKKSGCKMVFNAMHGKIGEDGTLQGILDVLGIPYTGSGVLASALTMDKYMTKKVLIANDILTPRAKKFYKEKIAIVKAKILEEFNLPFVIKAVDEGSSLGVSIVDDERNIEKALDEAFSYGDRLIVEEFVAGKELTIAVYGDRKVAEALPIIEITTLSGRYDYKSKYTKGASTHIIPARLLEKDTKKVQALAKKAFLVCNCQGIARIDCIFGRTKSNLQTEAYIIEVNSVPGMTELSLVPDAARASGMDFGDLCEKILFLAGFERN